MQISVQKLLLSLASVCNLVACCPRSAQGFLGWMPYQLLSLHGQVFIEDHQLSISCMPDCAVFHLGSSSSPVHVNTSLATQESLTKDAASYNEAPPAQIVSDGCRVDRLPGMLPPILYRCALALAIFHMDLVKGMKQKFADKHCIHCRQAHRAP